MHIGICQREDVRSHKNKLLEKEYLRGKTRQEAKEQRESMVSGMGKWGGTIHEAKSVRELVKHRLIQETEGGVKAWH